jgi:hypothetical protein
VEGRPLEAGTVEAEAATAPISTRAADTMAAVVDRRIEGFASVWVCRVITH